MKLYKCDIDATHMFPSIGRMAWSVENNSEPDGSDEDPDPDEVKSS